MRSRLPAMLEGHVEQDDTSLLKPMDIEERLVADFHAGGGFRATLFHLGVIADSSARASRRISYLQSCCLPIQQPRHSCHSDCRHLLPLMRTDTPLIVPANRIISIPFLLVSSLRTP